MQLIQKNTLIASVVGLTFGAATANAGLVGHWTFDDADTVGSTATDVTGGGADGAIGGNVTTGQAGVAGEAYLLGGGAAQADIVDMGNATSVFNPVNTSGEVTISAWFQQTADSSSRRVAVFLGDNTSSSRYIDIGVGNNDEAYGRDRSTGNGTFVQSAGAVGVDTWYHLVLTIDNATSTGTLYLDGVQVATLTGGEFGSFPNLNNLEVGRLGRSSPTDAFTGLVDDVQIYDQALTAGQVAFLFNNPGEVVPEPSSLALIALGGACLLRRRRSK